MWFWAKHKMTCKKVSFLGSVFGQAKMEQKEIIIPIEKLNLPLGIKSD